MFGDACKMGILLFLSLEDNRETALDSVGAGYAGSLPVENPAGSNRERDREIRYSETSGAGSYQSLWDVAIWY